MARKKVKLAYITNDTVRKSTFKKRQKGLLKKVEELSTLCGVNACAIVFGQHDSRPEVWPSPEKLEKVVSEFRMLPEMDQRNKMMNQESFLKQRISKSVEQLRRQINGNREKYFTDVMFQCLVGNMGEMLLLDSPGLDELSRVIDQFLKEIYHREEILRKSDNRGESSGTAMATEVAAGENPCWDNQMWSVYQQQSDPMEKYQQQPWYLELMNNAENMDFGSEELVFPSVYGNNNNTTIPTATTVPTASTAVIPGASDPASAGTNVWPSEFFQ